MAVCENCEKGQHKDCLIRTYTDENGFVLCECPTCETRDPRISNR